MKISQSLLSENFQGWFQTHWGLTGHWWDPAPAGDHAGRRIRRTCGWWRGSFGGAAGCEAGGGPWRLETQLTHKDDHIFFPVQADLNPSLVELNKETSKQTTWSPWLTLLPDTQTAGTCRPFLSVRMSHWSATQGKPILPCSASHGSGHPW